MRTAHLQPTLVDDLLLLRPLRGDDFVALFAVAKDPLIWEQHPANDRYKESVFIEFFREAMDSQGAFAVIDKRTGEIIGSSRYKIAETNPTAVEIGWTFLARAYWGGQFNGAMKQLMIDHAFSHFDYVILHIGEENMRSRKAAEKIGAQLITSQTHPQLASAKPRTVTYCIHREDWKNR